MGGDATKIGEEPREGVETIPNWVESGKKWVESDKNWLETIENELEVVVNGQKTPKVGVDPTERS